MTLPEERIPELIEFVEKKPRSGHPWGVTLGVYEFSGTVVSVGPTGAHTARIVIDVLSGIVRIDDPAAGGPHTLAAHRELEKHEGWTNRETWAVAEHINKDAAWKEQVHMAVRAAAGWKDEYVDGKPQIDAHEAGEIVKQDVETTFSWADASQDGSPEAMPTIQVLWVARNDIGSLWRVNWDEIGAAFLRDVAQQE